MMSSNIVHLDASYFNSEGYFKDEDSLAAFLQQAFNQGAITNPDFNPDAARQPQCCCSKELNSIKNLLTTMKGGAQTLQLFIYKSGCSNNEYIIKEPAEAYEAAITMQHAFDGVFQQFAWKANGDTSTKPYPILMLPTASLSYTYNGKPHYVVIMPKAPGIEFLDLLKEYKIGAINLDGVQEAYERLGFTLGYAQQKMGIVHNDFHARNVFYDPTTKNVYWIDLAGLQRNQKEQFVDLAYFTFTSNKHPNITPADMWGNVDQDAWVEASTESFLKGNTEGFFQTSALERLKNIQNRYKKFDTFGFSYAMYQASLDDAFKAVEHYISAQ